jgi:hypothetical protein
MWTYRKTLNRIVQLQEKTMALIDDLKTDFDNYKDDVTGKLGALQTSIDALNAGAVNADPTKLQALVDDINAAKAALDGAVAAPVTGI